MKTILVIDDEASYRRLCVMILEHVGYRVLAAASGSEALRLTARHQIDLLVSDVLMPDRDGIATIVAIHREHPEIKIIMMSGGGSIPAEYVLKLAGKFHAHATLRKPFTGAQLQKTVAKVLNPEPAGQ